MKSNWPKAEKITNNFLRNMKMQQQIFKLRKNKLPDSRISTMPRLNKLRKWAKSWIMWPTIREKCSKRANIRFSNIKMKLTSENKTFKS